MACTPFPAPSVGLFENSTQGVWANFNESKGGRTCSYSGGTLTVTGPNGSTSFSPPPGGSVRHKFFGTGNFLAILTNEAGPGTVTRTVSIVNFVAAAITSQQVIFVTADSSNSLPWLQNSPGNGNACLVGAPTNFGVAGLAILRSDTGAVICPGPGPFTPSQQIIGEVTAAPAVQIKHGGSILAGPCALPSGSLDVQPNAQSFATVAVGGCPQPASTRQFTLRNSGNDCLTISAVAAAGPFAVTAQSQPFPAVLGPGETMTVTVTFAPTAVGSFSNDLVVTRSPARGEDRFTCTGQAQQAQPALSAPAVVNFGTVPLGSMVSQSVSLTNSGQVPLQLSAPGSGGGPFSWPALSGPLGCGASTTIAVSFTPTAEGSVQATIVVTPTPGTSRTIVLQGVGCQPNAAIAVPPAPFPAFGDVRQGYRMPRFITIQNLGDGTLAFRASISGPDASLFGLMRPSNSITDVVASRTYSVDPTARCGPGPVGDGREEVVVVFHANAAPPYTASATLTIDSHNDPAAAASFTFPLSAAIVPGNVVDAIGVFDTSGSMSQTVPGGATKEAAAIQAGRLLVNLVPPDLGNRVAGVRFATDASIFLPIEEVTGANQPSKVAAVSDPPLTPSGNTAIAAGAMTALPQFAVPRAVPAPAALTKAVIVLTDGMENTAYLNPVDGRFYTILGGPAANPTSPGSTVSTQPFVPPSDVKYYAVGLGTGQDIALPQLAMLASGAGGYYVVVDPTRPAVTYELMKLYTQIYMDLVDTSVIADPRQSINPGDKHVFEFDVLAGDVSGIVVVYDFDGLRLPFWLETPAGELVDASFVPAGFALRAGATEASRFLDFVLPWGEPHRYAGRWRLIVSHDGRVCAGEPDVQGKEPGFLPRECWETKDPVEYGFVIGVGSNFRLQAYVTAAPVRVGDPIVLTAAPTEAGLPVTGCTVTVDATSPSGLSWPVLVLADDGNHHDGDAGDGEYARVFTNTVEAGTYTFRFRATGWTRDGEPVTRETIRSKYVEGTVRPPDGGSRPPGADECCEKLLKLLSRRTKN
jgi:hypothetical protein